MCVECGGEKRLCIVYGVWWREEALYCVWGVVERGGSVLCVGGGGKRRLCVVYGVWWREEALYCVWSVVERRGSVLCVECGGERRLCIVYGVWWREVALYCVWSVVERGGSVLCVECGGERRLCIVYGVWWREEAQNQPSVHFTRCTSCLSGCVVSFPTVYSMGGGEVGAGDDVVVKRMSYSVMSCVHLYLTVVMCSMLVQHLYSSRRELYGMQYECILCLCTHLHS